MSTVPGLKITPIKRLIVITTCMKHFEALLGRFGFLWTDSGWMLSMFPVSVDSLIMNYNTNLITILLNKPSFHLSS